MVQLTITIQSHQKSEQVPNDMGEV